jgi:hypothetical protein
MSNDKQKNLTIKRDEDEVQNILERATSGPVPLLKYKKTKYLLRDLEIPLGTRFYAYCGDWQNGWAKFVGDERVDKGERMGRVADKFYPAERYELGDEDESEWEVDDEGTPRDPWTRQDLLPIENVETGERLLFVTQSFGGRIAIESLCARWGREVKKGVDRGLPIIRLATSTFSTKKYGEIMRPDFPLSGWEFDGGAPAPRDVTPSKKIAPALIEEGPPEADPEDPHNFDDYVR